jgi:hypothetical protein
MWPFNPGGILRPNCSRLRGILYRKGCASPRTRLERDKRVLLRVVLLNFREEVANVLCAQQFHRTLHARIDPLAVECEEQRDLPIRRSWLLLAAKRAARIVRPPLS